MRRYFLNEANQKAWQTKQKISTPAATRVVYIITKWGGAELGEYDDFWDAVIDAEDKFCVDANMIDAYYVTVDEDGLSSYEPVESDKPFYGRWTEEEGTLDEPSQTYEEYLENENLQEASSFPGAGDYKSSWVARVPTGNSAKSANTNNNQNQSQTNATTNSQASGAFQVTALSQQEERDLARASHNGDRVDYALALLSIYMTRLAPKYGLNINDPKVSAFYGNGLDDLCSDVETTEAWPTIQEAEAQFIQVLGRAMTSNEIDFMKKSLAVLTSIIAPNGYCEIFRNAPDFYELRASNWLDSECDYEDYEYAFELGWAGNPEEDWTEMMGSYNHAGEYLEGAYAYGVDSRHFFKKVCGI